MFEFEVIASAMHRRRRGYFPRSAVHLQDGHITRCRSGSTYTDVTSSVCTSINDKARELEKGACRLERSYQRACTSQVRNADKLESTVGQACVSLFGRKTRGNALSIDATHSVNIRTSSIVKHISHMRQPRGLEKGLSPGSWSRISRALAM